MIALYLVPHVQDWEYDDEDKYEALQNLALTGKAWEPIPYEHLHYSVEVVPESHCVESSGCHTAEQVLSRLVLRPETASMVKELSAYYDPRSKNKQYNIEQLLKVVDTLQVTKDLKSDMKYSLQGSIRSLASPSPSIPSCQQFARDCKSTRQTSTGRLTYRCLRS